MYSKNIYRLRNFFSIGCLLIFCGCTSQYNLATRQEETLLHGTEKEIKIGEGVAQQIETHYTISSNVEDNERVQRVLDRIVEVCDRQELVYVIRVIDEDTVNAVSLPGGYIYIFKGLLDKLETDDQLAGVIAHEVAHIAAKHAMKRLQAAYGYALLAVVSVASGDGDLAQGAQVAYMSVFLAHSREDEFQSDELGVKYMKKAGYDPQAMIEVLTILRDNEKKEPLRELSYWRTHPYLGERISSANKNISGELHFRDYLNLMGNE